MPAPTLQDYAALSERRRRTGAIESPRGRVQVSLITVVFNACCTLAKTIDSVQSQRFESFEHVIVDGGSTDGSQELVRAKLRPHDYWVSERDRGISDAFNKGVALATGRYIQFINADDWLSPDQVAVAVAGLEASRADFVFGDLIFYRSGRPEFRFAGNADYRASIHKRMPALNHPTVLARREAFERIGLFDLRYRCAMDYDWFLRLHLAGGQGRHVPGLVGHMNHDGASNLNYARTYREVEAIAVAHGRDPRLARLERIGRMTKTAVARRARVPTSKPEA